jgi:hypothetical protein
LQRISCVSFPPPPAYAERIPMNEVLQVIIDEEDVIEV